MAWTDQPIRVFAVFVLAPILIYKGVVLDDLFVGVFGVALFVWDFYCILYKAPVNLQEPWERQQTAP